MSREGTEVASGRAGPLVNAGAGSHSTGIDVPELVAVILLSMTAILTAWTGFQATKWGGATSISFNRALAERNDATRQESIGNRTQTIQVALYTQWLQAQANRDQRMMDYLSTRFPEPLKTAFTAWLATKPNTNTHAPSSPFVMPEYQVPGFGAAEAADARADATFADAVDNNRRSDNYVLLTVAFASVLFFAAMSGRMKSRRNRLTLLGVGLALFATTSLFLVLFPKRI